MSGGEALSTLPSLPLRAEKCRFFVEEDTRKQNAVLSFMRLRWLGCYFQTAANSIVLGITTSGPAGGVYIK